jgi:putative ABC transport system substrate-binding protein
MVRLPPVTHLRHCEFITLLGGAAAAWPLAARAQQPSMPVIGYLGADRPGLRGTDNNVAVFRAALAETGYVEGRNVALEFRWAEGRIDRFPALAAELVRRQVAMIFANGTAAARAAKSATTTIPIVFSVGVDPVGDGLVASLNRPGANITGATTLGQELIGKRMELLHEIVPAAATIGYLLDPRGPYHEAETKEAETAARALGLQFAFLNASTPSQIETAFTTLVERRIGALTIGAGTIFLFLQHEQIIRLAARHGMPAIYVNRDWVEAGALMSYGPHSGETFRVVTYAGRILRGEKPADLPVQQVTKVELIINLKTAKALGLTVPLTLLGRADEVIE